MIIMIILYNYYENSNVLFLRREHYHCIIVLLYHIILIIVECSLTQLISNVEQTVPGQTSAMCGESFAGLGIENGVICYSGTLVGSTAIYFCFDCGIVNVTSVIRTCRENGKWDGATHHCECS